MRIVSGASILTTLLVAIPVAAGVFLKSDQVGNEPFIVVHPIGYDGTGGKVEIKVCAASPTIVPVVRRAIETWNVLTPATGNCQGNCLLMEDPVVDDTTIPYDMTSSLVHELGHCAMGLGHSNWLDTSFTNSKDAASINEGVDMIRGSNDDVPAPLPGTRVIHWFRKVDNDPVIIDNTVIDSDTFTRRILDLPAGHSWPASANREVATSLGWADTQAVMYTRLDRGTVYNGMTADEVNTDKFGMSGLDMLAGTSDDYTIELKYEPDCVLADIEILFVPLNDPVDEILAACSSIIEPIEMRSIQMHYQVTFDQIIYDRVRIEVDSNDYWDVVFPDGFESGDLSGWSAVVE